MSTVEADLQNEQTGSEIRIAFTNNYHINEDVRQAHAVAIGEYVAAAAFTDSELDSLTITIDGHEYKYRDIEGPTVTIVVVT